MIFLLLASRSLLVGSKRRKVRRVFKGSPWGSLTAESGSIVMCGQRLQGFTNFKIAFLPNLEQRTQSFEIWSNLIGSHLTLPVQSSSWNASSESVATKMLDLKLLSEIGVSKRWFKDFNEHQVLSVYAVLLLIAGASSWKLEHIKNQDL